MKLNGLQHPQSDARFPSQEDPPHPLFSCELASDFLSQGQTALADGNLPKALMDFDLALKHDRSANQCYSQGLWLFAFGREKGKEKVLLMASKKFKLATALNPNFFDAWQAWGSLLCALGLNTQEHHYFKEAKEKFTEALALCSHHKGNEKVGVANSAPLSQDKKEQALSGLYWDLGIVLTQLAERSEEPCDWRQAIDAFQQALCFDDKLPSGFWHDFSHVCLRLADCTNALRFYLKGIESLRKAVNLNPKAFESWLLLACAFEKLYLRSHDKEHFLQADQCFSSSAQIEPKNPQTWFCWGKFLCESAKRTTDIKSLRLSIEKLSRASQIDPENPMIQAVWAEALALAGDRTDRLDLIYDAEQKISECIEKCPHDPDLWYSYGICMQALGHYFSDSDYYYQAIEKFQEGLSIDRTCERNWHAMGSTYALLGELEESTADLELSLRFFQKAIDLNPSTHYLFDYASTLWKLGERTQMQKWLEEALSHFERLLQLQKNTAYEHPDWLFSYACTLDSLGDFYEEESYYLRAIEIFSHILMVDPDFKQVHHHLGLALSHLGELTNQPDCFYRSVYHYRLGWKNDEENADLLLDWATALINLATHSHHSLESDQFFKDAEQKIQAAIRLGNLYSYYPMACLFSLQGECEKGMHCLRLAKSSDALPPLDELLQEAWLDNVRSTGDFQEFFSQLDQRSNYQEEC